jgi:hypothetical protein
MTFTGFNHEKQSVKPLNRSFTNLNFLIVSVKINFAKNRNAVNTNFTRINSMYNQKSLIMKILFIIVITLIALILFLYIYFGGLTKIKVSIARQGGESLVYVEHTGDYRKSSILIDKIYYSLLEEEKVKTFKGFGIFYDDPARVDRHELRSEVGCVLDDPDNEILEKLAGKYKLKLYPAKDFIVAEFPYKGKMSLITGSWKVYSALKKFVVTNGLDEYSPVMEIYDVPGEKILYRKELVVKNIVLQ